MTPRAWNIGRGRPSWYLESEKNSKEWQSGDAPIFAYFRRSTKKIEQALSLENQADDIDLIIKENWFDKDKVMFFSESRSAYEWIKIKNGEVIRKRTEFTRMLHEMDSNKQPCIILVKDSSRLSRNKKDNEEITKRLFWEYGNKKVIKKIIFGNGTSWDIHSDIKAVDNELLRNYHSSVDTAEKGMTTAKWQLSRGIYSRKLPQWLSYWKSGNTILWLKQNERMPIVRKAFEMKQAGMTHKKISEYLRNQGIRTWERDLNDRYFSNLIYIGEYIFTDKRTWELIHYKNLKFQEGKTPISMTLWQGAQENKWKKNDNYGDKQFNYPLSEVLRTEMGRRLSGYSQKGTKQYANNTEWIRASEMWIIDEFLRFLKEKLILKAFKVQEWSVIHAGIVKDDSWLLDHFEVIKDSSIFFKQDFISFRKKDDWQDTLQNLATDLATRAVEKAPQEGEDKEKRITTLRDRILKTFDTIYDFQKTLKSISEEIESKFQKDNLSIKHEQEQRLHDLEANKNQLEKEKRTMMTNFLKWGDVEGMKEALTEELHRIDQNMKICDEQIDTLNNKSDLDIFCAKIPNLLKMTFELTWQLIADEENKELKEDMYELIKLMAFELKIKKKKALEIELFWPVRQVLFWENAVLEAPSGVEPDYGALQAPA